MELRDLYLYTHPWVYFCGKAYKSLVEIIGNKKFIKFAILGLPQSGKSHFICIVRHERYDPNDQTPFNGEHIEKKEVKLSGKTLVFERTRDINGLNLSQYPELIESADIVYFFFRADYFLNDADLYKMKKEGFTETDIRECKTYREIVFRYFGSVIRDKNAKNKPIKIVASFRKGIKSITENTAKKSIKEYFTNKFQDADFENCAFYVADIDDSHKDWVENNARELIFNEK